MRHGILLGTTTSLVAITMACGPVRAQDAMQVDQVAGQNRAQQTMGNSIDNVCPTLVGLNADNSLDGTPTGELQRICTGMVQNAVVLNGGNPPANGFNIADPETYNGVVQSIAGEELQTPQLEIAKVRQTQVAAMGARLGSLRAATVTSPLSIAGFDRRRDYQIASADPEFAIAQEGDDIGGLTEAKGGRFGAFVSAGYRFGDKDDTSEVEGFDFDTGNLVAGIDYRITPSLIAGVAIGYSRFEADFDSTIDSPGGQSLDNDSYSVSLYGTYYTEQGLFIDGVGRIGYGDYESDRHIFIPNPGGVDIDGDGNPDGDIDRKARGDFDSLFFDVGLTAGYDIPLGGATVTPRVAVSYARAEIDGFSEKGAGGLNLEFDDQTAESFTTTIGAQASMPLSFDFGVLTPSVNAAWVFELAGDDDGVEFRYAADPTGLSAFELAPEDKDDNYGELGFSLALALPNDISAFVDYQTVVALEDLESHAIFVGFRIGF
ncbi:MAG: autotransporter outer membrane beta-barrel domain-containing protein [Geminicoccaceae bacterium]|nr:autotransporter outer membrane beta-barrel domain-containing protein [Geminicoccaceae bacterium]